MGGQLRQRTHRQLPQAVLIWCLIVAGVVVIRDDARFLQWLSSCGFVRDLCDQFSARSDREGRLLYSQSVGSIKSANMLPRGHAAAPYLEIWEMRLISLTVPPATALPWLFSVSCSSINLPMPATSLTIAAKDLLMIGCERV